MLLSSLHDLIQSTLGFHMPDDLYETLNLEEETNILIKSTYFHEKKLPTPMNLTSENTSCCCTINLNQYWLRRAL